MSTGPAPKAAGCKVHTAVHQHWSGEDQMLRFLLGFFLPLGIGLVGPGVPPVLDCPCTGRVVVVPTALSEPLHALCLLSPGSFEGESPILEHRAGRRDTGSGQAVAPPPRSLGRTRWFQGPSHSPCKELLTAGVHSVAGGAEVGGAEELCAVTHVCWHVEET